MVVRGLSFAFPRWRYSTDFFLFLSPVLPLHLRVSAFHPPLPGLRLPGALFVTACAFGITGPRCCPCHCSHAFSAVAGITTGHQDSLCHCCSWGVGTSAPRAGRALAALLPSATAAGTPESLALLHFCHQALPQPGREPE